MSKLINRESLKRSLLKTKSYIDNKLESIRDDIQTINKVDSTFSLESENPVMNKVLTARINGIDTRIDLLPTKLSQFEDDVVAGKYLPLSGGTINGVIGAFKVKRNNQYASAIAFQNTIDNKANDLGAIGFEADGTPYVYTEDYFTKNAILTSAGGTISGNLTVDGYIIKSDHFFGVNNNDNAEWYVTDKNWQNTYTLLHSGNANKADVPWTASNILFPTGTSATWNIHSTNAYKGITVLNAVQAKPEGAPDHYAVGLSVSGYYGFTLASLGGGDVLLYRRTNETDWKTIAFTDSTVDKAKSVVDASGNALTLIHSGNIGSYKAGDSDKLGGQAPSYYIGQHRDVSQTLDANTVTQNHITHGSKWSNAPTLDIMSLLDMTYSYDWRTQIIARPYSQHIWARFYYNGTTWSGWKTIAFTDSNVDSAQTLKHSNGTVGATVDSSGSILIPNGQFICGVGTDTTPYDMLRVTGTNELIVGDADIVMQIRSSFLRLCYGSQNTIGILLNSSGNVTIGSSDLALTTTKLYVDGGIRFAPRTIWGQSFDGTKDIEGDIKNVTLIRFKDSGIYGIYRGVNYSDNLTANDLAYVSIKHAFYTSGYQRLFINQYGNVTIGADDLAGTNRRLFTDGSAAFVIGNQNNITTSDQLDLTKTFTIIAANNTSNYGLHVWINTSGCVNLQSSYAGFAANKSTYPIALNPLGDNVLIGTTTDNGVNKLQVSGSIRASFGQFGSILINKGYGNYTGDRTIETTTAGAMLHINYYHNGGLNLCQGGGNVGIGTANPAYRLDVNGDTHISGNLIVDGTITPSTASTSYSLRGGTSNKTVVIIEVGSTEETIEHGLGADVAVSLYAKDTTKDDSWVLTSNGDIEITDTSVIITFDNPTLVEYKVVIVG